MELDAPPGTQHWTTTLFSTLTDSFQNFQWIDFTIMLLLHLMPQQTVYPGPSLSTAAQLQPPLFSTGQWSWQELFPCILLAWGQYLMQRDPLPKKKKITWQSWQGSSELHTTHAQKPGQSKPSKSKFVPSYWILLSFLSLFYFFFLLPWILGEYLSVNRLIVTALCNCGYELLLQLQAAASLL